jgi:general secretion pathway protein K
MNTSRAHRPQRGAALLTAMIIVALVSTLAAAMIWQQWRAVQVEVAERGRLQSAWMIAGALQWAKMILGEDFKTGKPTALTESWAVPLAEARLSTFLAADKNNTDDGPEAFLSGSISDMQARYNLRNLYDVATNKVDPDHVTALRRLFQTINLPSDAADRIAAAFQAAQTPPGTPNAPASPPLMPESLDQLAWLGISDESIQQMAPYVVLLPTPTAVNMNTAPKEVLAAALNIGLGDAQRLVQHRQRTPFKQIADAASQLSGQPPPAPLMAKMVFVGQSRYFEVRGRLRLEDRALEESSLVERRSHQDIPTVSRRRESSRESSR